MTTFLPLACAFVFLTPLRTCGELLKTAAGVVMVGFAMCSRGDCSGNCYVCGVGALLNLGAGTLFYLVGQCKGHKYKEWMRETDRRLIPFHAVADLGNAVWLIAANYELGGGNDLAFDMGTPHNFPRCWWK